MQHNALSEEEQHEIVRRRIICSNCPFVSSNAVANESLNYKTNRLDEHCMLCGCNIDSKTACLSCNCGIEVFNSEHPENPMPLKWVAFEKPNPDGKD